MKARKKMAEKGEKEEKKRLLLQLRGGTGERPMQLGLGPIYKWQPGNEASSWNWNCPAERKGVGEKKT